MVNYQTLMVIFCIKKYYFFYVDLCVLSWFFGSLFAERFIRIFAERSEARAASWQFRYILYYIIYYILRMHPIQDQACLLTHQNVLFKSVLAFLLILLPFFFLSKKNQKYCKFITLSKCFHFKYAPHTIPSMSSCSVHRALQIDPKTWWREAFFFFLLLKKKSQLLFIDSLGQRFL